MSQIYKLSYKKCDIVNDEGIFLCKVSIFDGFGSIKTHLHSVFEHNLNLFFKICSHLTANISKTLFSKFCEDFRII
jgi:hypothetical protein